MIQNTLAARNNEAQGLGKNIPTVNIVLFVVLCCYSMGAPVMVELEGQTDPLQIAMKELK